MLVTQLLHRFARVGLGAALVSAAVVSAQTPAPTAAPTGLAVDVRAALAHGAPTEATRLIQASRDSADAKEFATALVEIYQGKDTDARVRLVKLVAAAPVGDASLEVALIDLRHGHRPEARQRLAAIEDAKVLKTASDYARIATVAHLLGDQQLALDAYVILEGVPSADLQTQEGDFLQSRDLRGDAVVAYDRALKLDPRWVPALVGKARAFTDDDPGAALKALAAAQTLAPDDPSVLLLSADLALSDGNWAAATEALDRLAAVKPGTVDEPADRAALDYAQDHQNDIDAQSARVRAVDPMAATAYVRAGQQAAQLYHSDDAAALELKAVGIDPDDWMAQQELGLARLRTGDEPGARTALEVSFKLNKSNRVTFNLLHSLDIIDQFEVVPDGDLIFKFPKDEAPILKLYALPLAEEAMKTFEQHYQFKPKGPILLEIFGTHDDFAVRTIGLMGIEGALGACFGRVISMDSPKARPPDEFSWQATEWHELAHVFTLQLSNYRVPRWLTEGISVFEEHRRNPAWGREVALQYAALWSQNKTFGVKGLPTAFKDPENFTIAYFEASLVVEHLVTLKGDAGLRDLLLAYAGGATDEQAFSKAFGQGVDAVDASFRQFVTTHLIIDTVEVHFIQTQRLLRLGPSTRASPDRSGHRAMVLEYSEEAVANIRSALAASVQQSQVLDRNFPVRVLKGQANAQVSTDQVRARYDEQEKKRKRLEAAGLISWQMEVALPDKDLETLERQLLWLYLDDMDKKLAVFDLLLQKIEFLTQMINARFLHKTFKIDREKGFKFTSTGGAGTQIPLESLSSGEQHELVLSFELLFRVKSGSFILIDEPELSLHVGWQHRFLDDLGRISELAGLDFLVATHSPQIIHKRWDLALTLGETE